uniref:Uncharacterized protein n=1 Tax=Rhizobium leguminosarum bv. viciae TaxID=387 RepID=A0A0U3HZW7_RHILV|nr:hypothetical protein [Rhizobium leguminosarum bv. viciae]
MKVKLKRTVAELSLNKTVLRGVSFVRARVITIQVAHGESLAEVTTTNGIVRLPRASPRHHQAGNR